jgi:hypothetical protein
VLPGSGRRTHEEFRNCFTLWRLFVTEEQKKELLKNVASKGEQAVKWLAEKLQPTISRQRTSPLTRRRV